MLHTKKKIAGAFLLFLTAGLNAQTEVSGFYPKKKELTIAPSYTYKSYDRFYLGNELADEIPANMGEISSQIFNIYGEYGISNRLSVSLNLPYISIENSTGALDPFSGESSADGLQDLSVFLKGKILEEKTGDIGILALGAAAGIGLPIGDYDGRGILSLGSKATAYTLNGIAQFTTKFNAFAELQTGYSLRDNSDYEVPNAILHGIKIGYYNRFFYIHSQLAIQNSIDGLDIGTPEFGEAGGPAALPQTEVDYTNLNFNLYIPLIQNKAGVSTNFSTTLDGRNTNKETSFSFGLIYKSF